MKMHQTFDTRITEESVLLSPYDLMGILNPSPATDEFVYGSRNKLIDILFGQSPVMAMFVGPCSVHDFEEAIEYGEKIRILSEKVKKWLYLIMRVYIEKPRTKGEWPGMVNDPNLNGGYDIEEGLIKCGKLFKKLCDMNVPIATEFVEAIPPIYLARFVTWSAVGARSTVSPINRVTAAGLSMPVGFKNTLFGGIEDVINAMIAAGKPSAQISISRNGYVVKKKYAGNDKCHAILRGNGQPNYEAKYVEEAQNELEKKKFPRKLVVDCSHGNSLKKALNQIIALRDLIGQRLQGNLGIAGLMLESNLEFGSQKLADYLVSPKRGVSITDECLSWDQTEEQILWAYERLAQNR